eukprot:GFKZ01000186.1.p2 GENE.GFKZ01000186.1~~GFKZ01000186.1.p2  ORF type:complete len:128 (+),score=36.54 GFKZ01000186.1:991-1374(+)
MAYTAKSQERIVELVKVGEERNKIAREVAAAQRYIAKSSKMRNWMEAFSIERTGIELKKQFARKLQRIALMEMDQELKVGSAGKNEEQDVQNTPCDFVPNVTVKDEDEEVEQIEAEKEANIVETNAN